MTNDDCAKAAGAQKALLWGVVAPGVLATLYAATYYLAGREVVDNIARLGMLAAMWLSLLGGVIFMLLGLVALIFGSRRDVPFLCVCTCGTLGLLTLSAMFWFVNYPLHNIETGIHERASQISAGD